EDGARTRLTYNYRVEVSGKVAAVGGRMLEGASNTLFKQFFKRLGDQVVANEVVRRTWWQRLLGVLGVGK
ncbi:MAG: SRPBCC domain-containing protein, partial [Haliea sp.]